MILPSKYLLPTQLSLLLTLGALSGCAANTARPGEVCGHCDYRFSHYTPNPCDPCVPEIELPGYGHTPTSWQVWPEVAIQPHVGSPPPATPMEVFPPPSSLPPQIPVPSSGDMSEVPQVPRQLMATPNYYRP